MNADDILSSTCFDSRYASNSLMRTYELEFLDGRLDQYIDYSDWNFTSIIKRLRTSAPYRYNGYEKFTTICYRLYGNTTIYRLVLIFNGFMHPYEIDSGTVISMPDPQEITRLIQSQQFKKQKATNGTSVFI